MNEPTKDELWELKRAVITEFMADPSTMGGRDRLWNHIRQQYPEISRRDVARALKEDPIHQQHQPLNKRVTTRPIVVSDRAKVVQIDLVDMQKLAGKNDGNRYFLTFVDLLSKYSAARPLKNKTQASVVRALEDILDEMPEHWRPKTIQADNGSEFQTGMANALNQRGIKLIHSQPYNPRSQGAVERLNKSIKQALFNLMARRESYRWVDFLQPLIDNLNTSKHESTGYRPKDLMERPELQQETIDEIHERMERRRPKHPEKMHHVYSLGDYVRVALVTESAIRKQTFRKKIMNNWSKEVYQIYSVSQPEAAGSQPQYLLKNLSTNRKSRKKYWGYALQLTDATIQEDQSDAEEASEPEEERYIPEAPAAPAQPRRSARERAPSQALVDRVART
jgi:transposase InsO family protein